MRWSSCVVSPASVSRASTPRMWYATRLSPGLSLPTNAMNPPSDACVAVQYACPRRGAPAAASLRRWAAVALDEAAGQVVIRVEEAGESRGLNRQDRHRDRPTNALSVPAPAPVDGRRAAVQGMPARAQWAHLVVHGCLHLLGYDHQSNMGAEEMEALERELLARLGFADP